MTREEIESLLERLPSPLPSAGFEARFLREYEKRVGGAPGRRASRDSQTIVGVARGWAAVAALVLGSIAFWGVLSPPGTPRREGVPPAPGEPGVTVPGTPPGTTLAGPRVSEPSQSAESLLGGLRRLRGLVREVTADTDSDRLREIYREMDHEWRDLRLTAFENSKTYFDFLRAPENRGTVFESLSTLLLGPGVGEPKRGERRERIELPQAMVDGLRELLRSGTKEERAFLLESGLAQLFNGPEQDPPFNALAKDSLFEECCLLFYRDKDPEVRGSLLQCFGLTARSRDSAPMKKLEGHLDILRQLWQTKANDPWPPDDLKAFCLDCLSRMSGPEARKMLLAKMGEVADEGDQELLAKVPSALEFSRPSIGAAEENPFLSFLSKAALKTADRAAFIQYAHLALDYPLEKATPVLERMAEGGPSPQAAEQIRLVLKRIRAGETRREGLKRMLTP
jgi:hypothetical protein